MTIEELVVKCEQAIDNPSAFGEVSLVIPGKSYGNTRRFPGLGVRGEIVCAYENACLCVFDAKKLLAALLKKEASEE